MQSSNTTLDFSHVIRDRLTSIALCANSLQSALAPEPTGEHARSFGIIQSSVTDIKVILDQLASCYHMEIVALKKSQNRSDLIGTPITSGAIPGVPKQRRNPPGP